MCKKCENYSPQKFGAIQYIKRHPPPCTKTTRTVRKLDERNVACAYVYQLSLPVCLLSHLLWTFWTYAIH